VSHSVNLAPPAVGLFFVRRGGLGKAVTELERKHLVETDRHTSVAFLPPSPPADQATARQDQTGQCFTTWRPAPV
jgi:hypothetical protein